MCIESITNILTAFATLLLAAVAIWQDQLLGLLNPAKGEIVASNFDGKKETDSGQEYYYYHVKAKSLKRWRPLKGTTIRFRQINHTTDSGRKDERVYPVWRQLYWAPKERCEARQTVINEQVCDLGRYDQQQDRFEIEYYEQGGECDRYVTRGRVAYLFLHLCADNLLKDIRVEITIDMTGAPLTKPKISLKKLSDRGNKS